MHSKNHLQRILIDLRFLLKESTVPARSKCKPIFFTQFPKLLKGHIEVRVLSMVLITDVSC